MAEYETRAERLLEKYKKRSFKEKLCWTADYTRSGYMTKEYEDFIRFKTESED